MLLLSKQMEKSSSDEPSPESQEQGEISSLASTQMEL
jgi:hypothetical protein